MGELDGCVGLVTSGGREIAAGGGMAVAVLTALARPRRGWRRRVFSRPAQNLL